MTKDSGRGAALAVALTIVTMATAHAQSSAPSLDALKWMAGAWTGTMGRAGIEEHWIAPAGRTMLAVSRTVVGDRTVSFEFLRLEERADGIYYVAQPGGKPPTDFKLTSLSGTSATFENPQHDMPKIIRYRRDDRTLVAEIEGDEQGKHIKQAFSFKLAQ